MAVPSSKIQKAIELLNSDLVAEAASGLGEVASFDTAELADAFFESSPLAFEITRVWTESNEEIIERNAIQALTTLLTLSNNEKAKVKLGWTLMKSERLTEKLVLTLSKKETERHIWGVSLLVAVARLQSSLAREIQAKFDFKSLTAKDELKKHLPQKGKPRKVPANVINLEKRRSEAIFALTSHTLLAGDEHASRIVLDGPLVGYCFENLLVVSSSSVKIFCDALALTTSHRLLLTAKCLANLARCAKMHPEDVGRDAAIDFLKVLLTMKKDRVAAKLIEFLDPIQDERHATLLEISLSLSKKNSLTEVFERVKGLSVLEPRASFPWIRTASLVCRLLLSCPPRGYFKTAEDASAQILPPESMLSRACLTRGLLCTNNLVKLYTLDLIAHMVFRAIQVLQKLDSPSEMRRFAEYLTKRLPEFSVLVNMRVGAKGSSFEEDSAETVLFLRSVRVLELYGVANVSCQFDVLKFFPSSVTRKCDALTLHRIVRLILAHQRSIVPDDWLKSCADTGNREPAEELTVLGSLLSILADKELPLSSTTREEMTYLACGALQSAGICESPDDTMSAASIFVATVADGDREDEVIVSAMAKSYVCRAIRTLEHAKGFNRCLARLRKNKRMDFFAAVEQEWIAIATSDEPRFLVKDLTAQELEETLDSVSMADYPEHVCEPLAEMLAEKVDDPAVVRAFCAVIQRALLFSFRFCALKAIWRLLRGSPMLSEPCLLQLNQVGRALMSTSTDKQKKTMLMFGTANEIIHLLRTYAARLLTNTTSDSKVTPLVARCAGLLADDDRAKFVRELVVRDQTEALWMALESDLGLALNVSVFRKILTCPLASAKILRELFDTYPAETCLLMAECGKAAIESWVTNLAETDRDDEFQTLQRLASIPGIVSMTLASMNDSAKLLLRFSCMTTSASLSRRLSDVLMEEKDSLVVTELAQGRVPPLLRSFVEDGACGKVRESLDEYYAGVWLRFYSVFKAEKLDVAVCKSIVAVKKKSAFPKVDVKAFLSSIQSDDEVALLICRHLVLCKRLKAPKAFSKLLAMSDSILSNATLQLILTCMELDPESCFEAIGPAEQFEEFFFRLLQAYHGTLSFRDRCIRRLTHLCEIHKGMSPSKFGFAFGQFLAPHEVYSVPQSSLLGSLKAKQDAQDVALVSGEFLEVIQLHFAWVTDGLDMAKLRRPIDLTRDLIPSCPISLSLDDEEDSRDDKPEQVDERNDETEPTSANKEKERLSQSRKKQKPDTELNDEDAESGHVAKRLSAVYDPSFLLRVLNHVMGLFAVVTNLPHASTGEEDERATIENSYENDTDGHDHSPGDQSRQQLAVGLDAFPARKWLHGGQMDFVIHCLASESEQIRIEAYSCLQRFAQLTSRLSTRFKERDQVLLVLRCLKSGIQSPYTRIPPLLSAYCQDFLNVVSRGASHPQYTKVNAFLFSSSDAGWDLHDIPNFLNTFNSGSMDFEQERAFTMRVLCKGVQSRDDLKLLSKRHVLELVLSAFPSALSDSTLRRLILQFLSQIASIKGGGALTLLKHGFLSFCLEVFDQLLLRKSASAEGTEEEYSRPLWRLADDRGGDDLLREHGEIAEELSSILRTVSLARKSLVARVVERDVKRARIGVGWFPRCEWSSDEAEFILAAPRLVSLICSDSPVFRGNISVFRNFVDILLFQEEILRLSPIELLGLVDAAADKQADVELHRKLVQLICTTMNFQGSAVVDDEAAARLIDFVLDHGDIAKSHSQTIANFMVSMGKHYPGAFACDPKRPLRLFAIRFPSTELEMLNEALCAVVVQKHVVDNTERVVKESIPKLLMSGTQDVIANDSLAILLQDILLGGDGSRVKAVISGFMKKAFL